MSPLSLQNPLGHSTEQLSRAHTLLHHRIVKEEIFGF